MKYIISLAMLISFSSCAAIKTNIPELVHEMEEHAIILDVEVVNKEPAK